MTVWCCGRKPGRVERRHGQGKALVTDHTSLSPTACCTGTSKLENTILATSAPCKSRHCGLRISQDPPNHLLVTLPSVLASCGFIPNIGTQTCTSVLPSLWNISLTIFWNWSCASSQLSCLPSHSTRTLCKPPLRYNCGVFYTAIWNFLVNLQCKKHCNAVNIHRRKALLGKDTAK